MATVAEKHGAKVKLRLTPRVSPDDRIRTFFFFESQAAAAPIMAEAGARGGHLGAAPAGDGSDGGVLTLDNLRLD